MIFYPKTIRILQLTITQHGSPAIRCFITKIKLKEDHISFGKREFFKQSFELNLKKLQTEVQQK